MRKILILPLLLLLLIGMMPILHAAETPAPESKASAVKTPDLPKALRPEALKHKDHEAKTDKKQPAPPAPMVLLDFYSHFCGVCLKMEPHVQDLETLVDGAVLFHRIDIADEANKPYLELFKITGTPTYILFDTDGKPVYKMEHMISSGVLKLQVLRHLNRLNKIQPPVDIPALKEAQETGKTILVSFQNQNCLPCTKTDPYLTVFGNAAENSLTVVRLNPDEIGPEELARSLGVKKERPFYLIMDPSGQELFRYQGEMQPKVLWEVLQTFVESGV